MSITTTKMNKSNLTYEERVLIDRMLESNDYKLYRQYIDAYADYHQSGDKSKYDEQVSTINHELDQLGFWDSEPQLIIKTQNLAKSYSQFRLHGIDLELYSGQVIGLVGENGNGKTTLLRILARDLSYNSGTLEYPFYTAGKDLYDLRTHLVYIPQRTPKWYGKVKDNLMFVAKYYGISPQDNETLVFIWMIRFGLWQFRDFNWSQLSSGYKMRFELVRTFLRNPKLLLLDEPLANLDILVQQLILEDLKMLGKSRRNPIGIMLSSQQLYEVEKVSDEVIFLRNGTPSSFNELKKIEDQSLVLEMEIQERDDWNDILQALRVIRYQKIGGNYIIEFPEQSSTIPLKQLLDRGVVIKYFRDITHSTRRFFS